MTRKKQIEPHLTFLVGFHAIPSMKQLHMHAISTDFRSPSLKTKTHWNSFHTPFFMPIDAVLAQLREQGRILVHTERYESYLKQPLKCHQCSESCPPFKTLPALKLHLESQQHTTNPPESHTKSEETPSPSKQE